VTTTIEAPAPTLPVYAGPGVYADLPAEVYHGQFVPGGSLSSTGARKLLAPSCPALFKYEQDNPPGPKKVFELGTAAHKLVLGNGPELVLVDALLWNTNAIKADVAAIRAAGAVPLKAAEYQQVHDMAAAILNHPEAAALLDPDHGDAEQSIYWTDPNTGITRRARIDWLRRDGRPVDYKSIHKADLASIEKAVSDHGYHQQDDWYRAGLHTLGISDLDTEFTFVFQEKSAPYLVTVVRLDEPTLQVGHALNQAAIQLYANCRESDYWPGYSDGIEYVGLPPWITRLYK
jgi:hypothetical protein